MGWAVPSGTCVWNISGQRVLTSTEVPLGKSIVLVGVPNYRLVTVWLHYDYFFFLSQRTEISDTTAQTSLGATNFFLMNQNHVLTLKNSSSTEDLVIANKLKSTNDKLVLSVLDRITKHD